MGPWSVIGSLGPWVLRSSGPWVPGWSFSPWVLGSSGPQVIGSLGPWSVLGSLGPWSVLGSSGPRVLGFSGPRVLGSLCPWVLGSSGPRVLGSLGPWSSDPWVPGPRVPGPRSSAHSLPSSGPQYDVGSSEYDKLYICGSAAVKQAGFRYSFYTAKYIQYLNVPFEFLW